MTAGSDAEGNRGQTFYNFAGRVVRSILKDGSEVRFDPVQVQGLYEPNRTNNPLNAPVAFQLGVAGSTNFDSRGNQTTTILDNRGQANAAYDGIGNLPSTGRDSNYLVTTSISGRGNFTSYTYDSRGNVLTSTTTAGTRTYTYESNFNQVTSETDEQGRKTIYDIDPTTGMVRSIDRVIGAVGGNDDLITSYTYTARGLSDLVTDPLGRITDYDYDAQGRTIKITVAKGTADEASQQFEYDIAGNQTASIDELGRRTEYRYDLRNRLIETIYPDDTPATLADNARTKSEFDLMGNQSATIDELGRRTTYVYDKMHHLLKMTAADPDGAGPLLAPEMRYEYDAGGNQTASIDQLGRRTEYQYDVRNRLVATIHPDGSRETSVYDLDNNLALSTDANGNRTARQYDNIGRLVRVTEPNGSSTFEYDSTNQLIAQTDANGNRTQYEYDELGRRVRTIDALGGVTVTSYDKNGNVISETDQLSRTTIFSYDNRDRQTTTTTALGFISRTIFDAVGNVVSAIDANNHATTFRFDVRNRQVEVIDALNQSTKTSYDAVGNVVSTTNQLNQVSTYRYDNLNRQVEAIDLRNQSTKTEYDAYGNVVAAIDALGQRTQYGYDLKNRRNTVTDALGKVTTTAYDAFGNVRSITDAANNTTSYEFPVQLSALPDNYTRVNVSSNGIESNNLTQNSSISADGRFVAFSSFANNLVLNDINGTNDIFVRDLVTGETTKVSGNGYDAAATYFQSPSISANGRFVTYMTYFNNQYSDISVYDRELGLTTRASVNSNGVGANSASFSPSISDDGRYVVFESIAFNLVPNDTNGSIDIFIHDMLTGETTRVSENSSGVQGNSGSGVPSISADGKFVTFKSLATNLVPGDTNNSVDLYVYNVENKQITKLTNANNGGFRDVGFGVNVPVGYTSISGNGRFIAFQSELEDLVPNDTNQNSDVFVYDQLSGVTTRVSVDSLGGQASGNGASISDDGRYVAFLSNSPNIVPDGTGDTAFSGYAAAFVHDLVTGETARVARRVDGNPKISADGRFISFGSYVDDLVPNDTNNAVDVFVSKNPLFSDIFPATNRLAREVNANGAARQYKYDYVGNITSIADRDGTAQAFTYDKLNRRTQEQWKDASGNITRSINSTYNAAGELTQISDPDSSYRYTYDQDGRMETVSNQDTPNVPTTILSYGYDNVGNVLSMTESINGNLGVTTSHQFDALNRMTQNTQGNKRVDYAYNALSQVTSKKRYSDSTGTNLVAETSHTFDNLNRLTDITHSKGVNVLANYSQAYDAKSRITGVTGTDGSSSFTYDNTDQLTGVDYSFQTDESYTYDDNGNRTNAGYVTGVNNRLLEDNKFRYEYDLVGNRTKRTDKLTGEETDYFWDIRDRMTGIVVKNALGEEIRTAQYKYDVYNQRIAKTVDLDGAGVAVATTERYVYGGDRNIDLIFDQNGNVSHRYLFGAGVDQIEADESGGSVLWALTDHLGSVRDVVDNAGVVQNHIVYDAFGGVTSQTNASVVFRYGYTARELDAESGLQYNRARYLDSFNGRFISEDPISFAGGDANLYRYVGNSATNAIDPTGDITIIIPGSFGEVGNLPENIRSLSIYPVVAIPGVDPSKILNFDQVANLAGRAALECTSIVFGRNEPIVLVAHSDGNRYLQPIITALRNLTVRINDPLNIVEEVCGCPRNAPSTELQIRVLRLDPFLIGKPTGANLILDVVSNNISLIPPTDLGAVIGALFVQPDLRAARRVSHNGLLYDFAILQRVAYLFN
jgi:RHS repeat-associated protein